MAPCGRPSEQHPGQPMRGLRSRQAVMAGAGIGSHPRLLRTASPEERWCGLSVLLRDGSKKKAASPRKGSGPQDLRSADQRLSKRLCCWTTVLRETRIGSCDRLTMSTAAECTTATKNDPAGGAGRPPLPATGGLRRRRLKLLPIAIANGRRGCTHCHAPRCRRGHGGTCSRARRRPLVAHSAGDG